MAETETAETISVGDRVRSFDFPRFPKDGGFDAEGPNACFVEGVVTGIADHTSPTAAFPDCDRYIIRVERVVFSGKEGNRRGEFVYPPVNNTPNWMGGVTNGVRRVEDSE